MGPSIDSTLDVQYGYNAGEIRLASMTYPGNNANPSSETITYNYNSVGQITSMTDGNNNLVESYTYLGLGTVVQRANPEVTLTYLGGSSGNAVTGLNGFGQVVEQKWVPTNGGQASNDIKYGYDADGNVLYAQNLLAPSLSQLYHANGSAGYDNFNQIQAYQCGTLSSCLNTITKLNTTVPAVDSQTWSANALGDDGTITTNGTAQGRSYNSDNELTVNSSPMAYDANGNLVTDQNGNTLKYDAWNRLVAVKNNGNTL